MNEEAYATALKTALAEIKNVCPDLNSAYILLNNGKVISNDDNAIDPTVEKAMNTLQELTDKSLNLGGLSDLVIDGDKGKIYVSQVNGTYSVMALSKRADLTFLRTITNIVFPTVLKVLEGMNSETSETLLSTPLKSTPIIPERPVIPTPTPMPLEPETDEENGEETAEETEKIEQTDEMIKPKLAESTDEEESEEEIEKISELPSQQLIVDKFGGLMVRSDTIQLDSDVLDKWASTLNLDEIHEVDIETFRGKTVRCKAKLINDEKLQGRGIIRIPEKTCDALELKRGELVRVKPVVPEE
jgi:predicted regulator of Ras-like GTPase activity (Roadblock/LC7/MglB family)